MQAFLNKKNSMQRMKWTKCVINFIESIFDHINDSAICVWDDNDAMSPSISRTNRVTDAISNEMMHGGYPMGHWFKESEDHVPWTLLGTCQVFIAIIIALNIHVFDQKSEMFNLINSVFQYYTPNSFSHNQPFELLEKCLQKVPKKIILFLEAKSRDLFRVHSCDIFQMTGWQYLEFELKNLKKTMNQIFDASLEDVQEFKRKQEDQIIRAQELLIKEPEEYTKYEHVIIRVQWDRKLKLKKS